jgi:hypothetical protein
MNIDGNLRTLSFVGREQMRHIIILVTVSLWCCGQATSQDIRSFFQTVANNLRATLPPEAQCEKGVYGDPECTYTSSAGGTFNIRVGTNIDHVVYGFLNANPGNSPEAERVGNLMFGFFEKQGFSVNAIHQCIQTMDHSQPSGSNKIELGNGWSGSCTRNISAAGLALIITMRPSGRF